MSRFGEDRIVVVENALDHPEQAVFAMFDAHGLQVRRLLDLGAGTASPRRHVAVDSPLYRVHAHVRTHTQRMITS